MDDLKCRLFALQLVSALSPLVEVYKCDAPTRHNKAADVHHSSLLPQNVDHISPALPLTELHTPSSNLYSLLSPPPLLSPSCLSRVTFLPYSPFIRDRQQAKAFHTFLPSLPPLRHLSQTPSLAFLQVFLLIPISSPHSVPSLILVPVVWFFWQKQGVKEQAEWEKCLHQNQHLKHRHQRQQL